ncbi:DNA-directed RNA polymerase V subunit 7-like protein [Tanacetum coccineum]
MLQKAILVRLLDDFSEKKATKALGYLLAGTTLDKIGKRKAREYSGDVLFPLFFTCLSFKVFWGETGSRIEKDVTVRCIVIGDKVVVGLEEITWALLNH